MAEEQVVVTPKGGCDLGGGNELSDKGLSATELLWCTHSVEVIDFGTSWDLSKVIQVIGIAFSDSGRLLEIWNGSKAQLPWEENIVLIGAFLGILGHVRETHRLNIVGGRGKAGF